MKRNFCFYVLMSLMLLGFSSTAVSQFGDPAPYHPQEMDGMVNMINRSLVFSETDLAIPGRGLGLNFTRYYNSSIYYWSLASPGVLGGYWTHNYLWSLQFSGSRTQQYTVYPGHPYSFQSTKNTLVAHILTPQGAKLDFSTSGSSLGSTGWQNRIMFNPKAGVRGSVTMEQSGTDWAYIYTTKAGIRYKFEALTINNVASTKYVLTEIAEPNGNVVKLHYESAPETPHYLHRYPRLIAVEDPLGRILKFHYGLRFDDRDYPRFITKVEFGLGTKTALTTVYNTVKYTYTRTRFRNGWRWTPSWELPNEYFTLNLLTAASHQLGTGDPRGTEIKTQYEYDKTTRKYNRVYLSAIVAPGGNRTEFDVDAEWHQIEKVRVEEATNSDGSDGDLIYERKYQTNNNYYRTNQAFTHDNNTSTSDSVSTGSIRKPYSYDIRTGAVTKLNLYKSYVQWSYDSNRNVTGGRQRSYHSVTVSYSPSSGTTVTGWENKWSWQYTRQYSGSNPEHNRRMGNSTKWEQRKPVGVSGATDIAYGTTVVRTWEADYETKFNRPIWQIDSMGHKTTFTYDTKGNLTEQRSKANTGTQPHAVDHDIITKHEYDSYGNRIKTIFMPDTTQEKVVETVYDSTHHTYPIEVKTTVTVDGAAHTIKTKSEWDMNRGLKTADIDAQGRRTEYAYWQDRALKYTKRVADNMYTIPTYDKNGNVTQTQVRQNNWQTGTLIAQTKTEYDAMDRAVKVHSFNAGNWTTPYATTETTYDIFGDVSETKDPRGLKSAYTRDYLGRVTKQTLPDGDWVETRYNAIGQITKAWTSQTGTETSPAVSNTYDNLNRLSQVSYKTGESVGYTYDLGDNVLTQQTNDGTNTYTYTYTHDQLNRVKNRNDSLLGYKTFYEYDDASMRKRMYIQPSAGGTNLYDVKYAYDEANRLLSVTDALAAKTASYAYYDIGALKTVTNPNGITAHRTLDTLNRLDTLQYKKTATTVLSSLDYTYDVKSNVTQLVRNDTGAGGTSKTFTFGYDNISRLTSANYGNETVSYTYDKAGNRLTQVSSIDGTTAYTVATNSNQLTYRSLVPEDTDFSTMSYTYDAEGKLTQRSEGTDSDAFTYGFGSQLKQIQKTRNNAVTQTLTYAYDGSGKRVKVTDSHGTRYFLYDGLMPLLELDASKGITASYLYGADGVVYRRKHNAVAYWHFDEGNGTVAHDVDGQHNGTLGDGDTNKSPAWSMEGGGSLLFDGTNDVLKVADSDALDLVGNTLTISCWVKRSASGSGNLVKKADASNGYRLWITSSGTLQFDLLLGGTTKTVTSTTSIPLNTWKHVAARYNGSKLRIFIGGTIETTTTAATASLAATTEALWMGYYDATNHHLNGYIDDVSIYDTALTDAEVTSLSNNQLGRYEYHHTNALGSNIILTDDVQTVLARYEYDVFGAVRSEVGTSDNPRKFTGKEYESDVKLYYFAARYYDPYIGRFTQRDPAGDGINWYAYAYNNPLGFVDPTGLASRLATQRELAVFSGAASFSFGETNAAALMDSVTIRIADRNDARRENDDPTTNGRYFRIKNTIKIYADNIDNYMIDLDVWRLGTFVHELTHAWQDITGYQNPVGSGSPNNDKYDHTIYQLKNLELDNEQMARAVQQHYIASHRTNDSIARHMFMWWDDYTGARGHGIWLSPHDLADIASSGMYAPLLNMIRQPMLGATTLGGVKGGQ